MEFTGTQVLTGLVIITAVLIGVIQLFRLKLAKGRDGDLTQKYQGTTEGNSVLSRKYPEANVFGFTSSFWGAGIVCALAFTILAFNWTQYEYERENATVQIEVPDEIEMNIPPTATPPPPPPPPPPPVIQAVPDDEILEQVKIVDQSIDETTTNEPPPVITKKPEKPITKKPIKREPEPELIVDIVEVFTVVEQMPRFPGCEGGSSNAEMKTCAEKKMLEFIYKNIKYPSIASENGLEGTVVVRFVVDETGQITKAKILRDIGGGCGKEALRVVEKMNDLPDRWTPGKQRNQTVKVQFNLPVRFKMAQ